MFNSSVCEGTARSEGLASHEEEDEQAETGPSQEDTPLRSRRAERSRRGKRTGTEGQRGQDSGRRDFTYNFNKSEEEPALQNIQAYAKELPVLLRSH